MPEKKHGPRPPLQSGFTLIELVVVLSLISVMLFFSIPRFGALRVNDPSREASQWIMANVRLLKERSLRERKSYMLHVGIDTGRLWTTDLSVPEEDRQQTATSEFILSPEIRILDVEYPQRGILSTGRADIHFSEQGYSDKAVIHLVQDHGQPRSFFIEPFLPEVKIYDRYKGISE